MNPEDPPREDDETAPETAIPVEPDGDTSPPPTEIEAAGEAEPDIEPKIEAEPEPDPEPEPPLTLDPPVVPPRSSPPRVERPVPPPPPRRPARTKRGFWGFVRALFVWGFVITVVIPVSVTLIYRFVPPPFTILMVQRAFEGKGWDYRWRSLDRISPALVQAAVAAEDARFCEHNGFDFQAIEKAMANNKRRPGRIKGGSTISQQTAKNVFLWPARSWVRKGLEAYYTVLIETIWGKRRIMEVYLNVAEMGEGTYGAEAAARRYFGVGSDQLTRVQASRLVAILPNPLKYRAVKPGKYVAGRSRRIGAAAGTVRNDGLAACVGRMRGPTAAERAEPDAPARPTARRPAPEKTSGPLPAAAAPEPALPAEPAALPLPEAPPAETPPTSD